MTRERDISAAESTAIGIPQGGVLLVHAFSRRNAGDGLLVDLALERLTRAGIDPRDISILALDPESFSGPQLVIPAPGDPGRKVSPKVLGSLWQWVSGGLGPSERIRMAITSARAVVGVGGGYLRATGPVTAAGVLVNHGHILKAVADSTVPSLYLPQSIGPLRGAVGRRIGNWLSQVDVVCLRDDWSVAELTPYLAGVRIPDMAVLEIADVWDESRLSRRCQNVIFVPRRLSSPGSYQSALGYLGRTLPEAQWAVQSAVAGGKDDTRFIERMGFEPAGSLGDFLISETPAVVVSVRLHGALQALIRGFPAIHLSYERKGWAAFEDLGLSKYVHDARRFDPHAVLSQVEELREDPGAQWEAVGVVRPKLTRESERLSELVSRVVPIA